jgi:hypothetical protein
MSPPSLLVAGQDRWVIAMIAGSECTGDYLEQVFARLRTTVLVFDASGEPGGPCHRVTSVETREEGYGSWPTQ